MKHVILLAALIWVAEFAKAQTPTPPPGVIETYKVVNGMSIRATVYNVADGQRHRVAIAIHGGSYSSGTMQTNVAQDVSQYGFMGVAIEYRQAPPHIEMNTPEHPFPGQNDIHDDGHYPEQTDDVGDAIVHYRNDPRSIWPKGRPDPKPSLDAVMSQTQRNGAPRKRRRRDLETELRDVRDARTTLLKEYGGNEPINENRLRYFRDHAPAEVQKQYDNLRIRMDEIQQLLKFK